jgi:hypothetical protein
VLDRVTAELIPERGGYDLVPAPEQPADHVATHPAETYHRQLHRFRLPPW